MDVGGRRNGAGLPVPVRLGLATSLILAATLAALMLAGALDPVQLLVPGQKGSGGSVLVEDFGIEKVPDRYSYDGQQFYLAARYFPDIEEAGSIMGGPRFRLLRIGLPALASVGGDGTGVVILLIAWNIVGVGLAVGSLADLAQRHGRRPEIGAAAGFALTLPLLLTTSECLAFGFAFLALALAHRGRVGWSIAALAAAGLTREGALTFAAGLFVFWLSRRQFRAIVALPLAAVPLLLWRIQLLRLLPPGADAPLGFLDFLELGRRPAVDQAVAALVVGLGVWALIHWRRDALLWPVALGSLAWFAIYEYDTYDWLALPRVAAPLVALGLAGIASVAYPRATATGTALREETDGRLG